MYNTETIANVPNSSNIDDLSLTIYPDELVIKGANQPTNESLVYVSSLSNGHKDAEITTKGWIFLEENIVDINVIVPNKVVEITFGDGKKEKMVCHKDDKFDLRKCCFIAIAKHLYKEEFTFEGIEYMAERLMYQKKYVKIVKDALRNYRKKKKKKRKSFEKKRRKRLSVIVRDLKNERRKNKEHRNTEKF